MKWWKALGVAAFVGVAATGVAIARAERERRAYTPEQVRDRLHARVAEVDRARGAEGDRAESGAPGPPPGGPRRALRAARARLGALRARVRSVRPPAAFARQFLRGERHIPEGTSGQP
ncbi:hypothetical protein [Nocardiopsis sp. NPDC006938]|uniref:hypothetical protein n=1 Tax=Nocardiopsis sp. NPDC006938 TaxID=3364337 RepID=UPI0036889F1D